MVFGRRSAEEGVDRSRNPNPSIHLRSPRPKIRKDELNVTRQIGLLLSKEELEALVRKVVREEVSQALRHHAPLQRSSHYEAESSISRSYQLSLECGLPNRVFTGNKIEAEGQEPMKVVLLDANTRAVVSDGPLSSLRVECVVLQGDFKAEEQAVWNEKDFNDNILREREGRRPLLIGERYIMLNNGVGYIKDVSFTDNSSWVRSKRFRLGVRVVQGVTDVGVQEGVSGAFEVRDRRGEPYQKHGTPSLEDEVWRLYKIAKGGPHSIRLAAHGIQTVKDFLQRYYVDEPSLRMILNVSNKVWEAIVAHAKSCALNNDYYSYFSAEEGVGLRFNCVFNIVEVTYDAQNYQCLETLSKAQKLQVDKLRRYAYQNQSELIPADAPATPSMTSSPCEPIVPSNSSSMTDLHLLEDQPQKDMDYDYTESPLPYPPAMDQTDHIYRSMSDEQIRVPSSISDLFSVFCDNEPTWFSGLPSEPSSPDGLFPGEDSMLHVQDSSWFPATPSMAGEGNSMLVASSSNSQFGILSPLPSFDDNLLSASKKPQAGCSKVRAAVTVKVLVGKDGNSGTKNGMSSPSYYY